MNPELLGIHHVTAVTAHARDNHQFYTRVLGMRLVKKTVNQDDVSAYHLFYADAQGSPGSDLTFFDWAHTPRQRNGNNSISRSGLRVGGVEDRVAAKGERGGGAGGAVIGDAGGQAAVLVTRQQVTGVREAGDGAAGILHRGQVA